MGNREEYIQKAKARLDKLNADIDRLEANTEEVSAAAEIKRREILKLIRKRQATVEDRMRSLQKATELEWDDVRMNFETALSDLIDTFERTRRQHSSTNARS